MRGQHAVAPFALRGMRFRISLLRMMPRPSLPCSADLNCLFRQ